ncbi:MAG: ribonuclease R [Aerococcus sp.]|nr:ribonuclease R [Aerococcus sp.]
MENQEIRKQIIQYLSEATAPVTLREVSEHLQMQESQDYTRLARLVAAMDNDREIVINGAGTLHLPLTGQTLEGSFRQNKKGFGFVRVEESESDIFVGKFDTFGAMNQDTVKVLVKKEGDDVKNINPAGQIVAIVERKNTRLTGEFKLLDDRTKRQTGFIGTVHPLNKGCENMECFISADGLHPVNGEIVVCDITKFPDSEQPMRVEAVVNKIIGAKDAPGSDILAVLSMFDIPSEFPEDVQAEADLVPEEITDQDREGRTDYRDELTITIDGAESKDLDDAVSLRKLANSNYLLGVHIADVSYYVTEGSNIDQEAYARGTSVYLTDRVVPMLPQRLSNGICSLNEGQERLTMSCVMEIDPSGKTVDYQIGPSLIRSNHRMTYDDVNAIIEKEDTELSAKYADIVELLHHMAELHRRLEQMRHRRGAIDFDTPEAKIIVDQDGHPIDIQVRDRGIAERMIESFMLAANETVAREYTKRHLPMMYRVHEHPEDDRIKEFKIFAQALGVNVPSTDGKVTPKDLQQTLNDIEGKSVKPVIQMMMLRSMQQAKYAVDPLGHYGLAAPDYTHFTSPIRRYPDLTVHRLIRKYLTNVPDEGTQEEWAEQIAENAEHSSTMERRSIDAEREVDSMKKSEYMVDKIGETFDAIISSITGFGMFVELPNTVEGLVHISTLKEDYFNFDQDHLLLIGERTGKIYRIGEPIKVKLIDADPETRQIDFQLVDENGHTTSNSQRSRNKQHDSHRQGDKHRSGRGNNRSKRSNQSSRQRNGALAKRKR